MDRSDTTCWTVIKGAAEGRGQDREEFARLYLPTARAYLCARWRGTGLTDAVDDTVQEVFVDCFREGGALGRADPERGGFKAFFYGVVRNVALRVEKERARSREHDAGLDAEALASREKTLSAVFDEAWALSVLEQAVARHREAARGAGEEAERRVELLRLRFQDGLPVRDIATRWEVDPARVHKEYARARREFKEALLSVVGFHHPGPPGEVERECAQLLSLFR